MTQMTAEAAAQHLQESGAIQDHKLALSAEDRHRTNFIVQVCQHLGLKSSFENVVHVSRALAAEAIEAFHGHEYPKWVLAGDGHDVVVNSEDEETFAAKLQPGPDFDAKRKSPYAKAEDHGGDGVAYAGYAAPAQPVRLDEIVQHGVNETGKHDDQAEGDAKVEYKADNLRKDPDPAEEFMNQKPKPSRTR